MASLTPEQRDILIKTILGEARGEGEEGMAAVAHVIANRAGSGRYPGDPAQVALQPKQFSTWNRGEGGNNPGQFRPGTSQYETAAQVIDRVFSGQSQDPTNGALFYHTPAVNPNWSREANRYGTTQLGNHIFYNGRPVPPRDVPNAVATQLDVRPPVTGSPKPMPPQLAAQRQLTAQLSGGQTTAPDASFYGGIYTQPPALNRPGAIDASVRGAASGQNQPLASALEQYAQQQAQRVPYSQGQTVGTISTRPPVRATPRQPNAQERAALAYVPPAPVRPTPRQPTSQERSALSYVAPKPVPYSAGRTVASIPTTPRLPPVTPQPIPYSAGRTVATVPTAPRIPTPPSQPTLEQKAAINAVPTLKAAAQPRQPNAAEKAALASTSGVGKPPATRVVQSVPAPLAIMRQPTSAERAALAYVPPAPTRAPNAAQVQSATGFRVPNMATQPSSAIKSQDRLTAGVLPGAPASVATSAVPLAVTAAAPPMPRPRPARPSPLMASVSMPTPVSQRPMGFAQPMMPVAAQRPALNVTVQGARTDYGSGGGSSSPSAPRYEHKGREVYATPTKWYNASTNQFENVTTYKPR